MTGSTARVVMHTLLLTICEHPCSQNDDVKHMNTIKKSKILWHTTHQLKIAPAKVIWLGTPFSCNFFISLGITIKHSLVACISCCCSLTSHHPIAFCLNLCRLTSVWLLDVYIYLDSQLFSQSNHRGIHLLYSCKRLWDILNELYC